MINKNKVGMKIEMLCVRFFISARSTFDILQLANF